MTDEELEKIHQYYTKAYEKIIQEHSDMIKDLGKKIKTLKYNLSVKHEQERRNGLEEREETEQQEEKTTGLKPHDRQV